MANTGGGVIILGVDEKEDGTMEAVGPLYQAFSLTLLIPTLLFIFA